MLTIHRRSLDILKEHFQTDVLEDQDPFASDDRAERLLQMLPDKSLNDALRQKWSSAPGRSSISKWADIDALAKKGSSKSLDPKALLEAKQDIVLEYTYPRLDIEVSKKLNHLLKSPLVVHPGTGRVCVPIDTRSSRKMEEFDPLEVPNVLDLLQQIDRYDGPATHENGKPLQDWEKTTLRPYIEYFRAFVAGVVKDEREVAVKREREEGVVKPEAMEF
jgi:DNA primase small subunit